MTSIVFLISGGNFCGGYDLQELSTMDSSTLPSADQMNGRGPMVGYIECPTEPPSTKATAPKSTRQNIH